MHYQTFVAKRQTRQCLALVLLGQCARLRLSAQCFDCIIEKRRGKLRHKKIISEMNEILVVYNEIRRANEWIQNFLQHAQLCFWYHQLETKSVGWFCILQYTVSASAIFLDSLAKQIGIVSDGFQKKLKFEMVSDTITTLCTCGIPDHELSKLLIIQLYVKCVCGFPNFWTHFKESINFKIG